jgi:phospholipase/lecithinase/hemolysin
MSLIAGFKEGHKVCCGTGSPYNYNKSEPCSGSSAVTVCDDPSKYVGWDGIHFTDAANRLITDGLINGPYTFPQFSSLCLMNQNYGNGGYSNS